MKLVIDTNVLVSGIFWAGKPRRLLNLWAEEKIELQTSWTIPEEYLSVIDRIASKHSRTDIGRSWSVFISANTDPVDAPEVFTGCRDPFDHKFVDCAWATGTEIIVSGDRDLLDLEKKIRNVRILSPAEALKAL